MHAKQQQDPAVQRWKKEEEPSNKTEMVNVGVLCRRWRSPQTLDEETVQVALPKEYRSTVMKLAHDVPMSEHLNREKTLARVR